MFFNIFLSIISASSDKAQGQIQHILPDYMLVFSLPLLTHYSGFITFDNVPQLQKMKEALWFVLEPLILKNDFYCFGFYKDLIERMKNHRDAIKPDDDPTNYVIIDFKLILLFFTYLKMICLTCIFTYIFVKYYIIKNLK